MRTVTNFAITALILLSLAGCAQSPHAEWTQARQTLTATQNTLLALYNAKLIEPEDLRAADPIVKAARGTLADAEKELPAELNAPATSPAFERYMKAFYTFIEKLDAIQQRAKEPTSTPLTEPINGTTQHPRRDHNPLQSRRAGGSPRHSATQPAPSGWAYHARTVRCRAA